MTGASDAEVKKKLKDALTAAWSVWTEGIDMEKDWTEGIDMEKDTTALQLSIYGSRTSIDSGYEGEEDGGGEGESMARTEVEAEVSLKKNIFDSEEDKQGIV